MNKQRDSLEYDVAVIGAGPAGLSMAIRLKQIANRAGRDVTVCLIEKGEEVGAHIISGAVIEPRALEELVPDWKEKGAPLLTPVGDDEFHFLTGKDASFRLPHALVPRSMRNAGNYIVSLGRLCRWLGRYAEDLGVDVLPGYAAKDIVYGARGEVRGVIAGVKGISKKGEPKGNYEPGVAIHALQTVLAEGSRGHLGKEVIERFSLSRDRDPQHYAIGLKEVWEVDPACHREGWVLHGSGWPLSGSASGGCFMYHLHNNQVAVGLIVDLNYSNPWLSPFEEFQRLKHHPLFSKILKSGRRIGYGARAISKGGLGSLPKMVMPGAMIIGCDAGTLNFGKIKGTHTAMKSGIVAADTVYEALEAGLEAGAEVSGYANAFSESWAGKELHAARNVGAAIHRFGAVLGGAWVYLEQALFRGFLPFTLRDSRPDHATLTVAQASTKIEYERPDGVLSFDKASSVYLSGTNHEEDQPCHLVLRNKELPLSVNLPKYGAPEQRYCPAGVYEIVEEGGGARLQINAQNCLHCKTCDIKDPTQNIDWKPPEDGGPAYSDM